MISGADCFEPTCTNGYQIKEKKLESTFKWSLIDRWPLHSGFIDAVTDRIMTGLEQFDEADRHKVCEGWVRVRVRAVRRGRPAHGMFRRRCLRVGHVRAYWSSAVCLCPL